jgi:hypothetical protein
MMLTEKAKLGDDGPVVALLHRAAMTFVRGRKVAGGDWSPPATSTGSKSRTITDDFPGQEAHRGQTP